MSTTVDLVDLAAEANSELAGASALEILAWAYGEFGSKLVVASSMTDTVLIHLAEQVTPGIDVIFLDTGYHFVETIGTRDAVQLVHNVNVINVTPEQTVAEQDATWGKDLFARDPDQCCALRKVAPLGKALEPYAAWATGLRRADSAARAATPVVSWDSKRKLIRIAPIATWTDEDVARYIETNSLMINPLLEDGYTSIGCQPCTSPRTRRRSPCWAMGWIRQDRMRDKPVNAQAVTAGAASREHLIERAPLHPARRGATLWFTGLPSAGKSTIAHALARDLDAAGERVQVLDGDDVRPHLSAGLGFSREDRDVNVTRIGWVARMLASHGVIVLVSVIAPYATARDSVRNDHGRLAVPFAEVHVATSLQVAEARDVKGLYARARRGELKGLTGVDDPYEVPTQAELVVDTARVDLDTAVEMSKALLAAIVERDFG